MYKEPGECQFDDRDKVTKENESSLLDRLIIFVYNHRRWFGGKAVVPFLVAILTTYGCSTAVQPTESPSQDTKRVVDTQNSKGVVTFPTASPSPTTDGNKKEDGKP